MVPHVVTPIVLSDEEALELYRRMRYDYLSVRDYPALSRLLDRLDRRVGELARVQPS